MAFPWQASLRRYVHVGTGNYHEGTARLYEDLGLLSADPELAAHAAAVFNELTAGIPTCGEGHVALVGPAFAGEPVRQGAMQPRSPAGEVA